MKSPIDEVFAYWQQVMEKPQTKLTPGRRDKIKTRLKTYSVAALKLAIDGCASSAFHMGQNETNTVYNDLTLICRNDEKIDFFMQKATSKPEPKIEMPTGATAITSEWLPSEEAIRFIVKEGISRNFIEDSVPEFVLYWRECRGVSASWNAKFVSYIRRMWKKYTHAIENDTSPRPIPLDFMPAPECFEILRAANINDQFVLDQLAEFILYWRERNEIHPSWNTKFLQHVKYKWAQQIRSNQPLLEKLTDRSWAD